MSKYIVFPFVAVLAFATGLLLHSVFYIFTLPAIRTVPAITIPETTIALLESNEPLHDSDTFEEDKYDHDGIYFPNETAEDRWPDIALVLSTNPEVSGEFKIGKKFYRFKDVKVSEKTFSFTTFKVKGRQYKFEGRFLDTGEVGEYDHDLVLGGTLKTFSNGKKVREFTSKYSHTYEVCAWRDEKFEFLP